MTSSFTRVDSDDKVMVAAKAMQKSGTTEAVVIRDGAPIGIVTEKDILYKVVAEGLEPSKVTVRAVMNAPVATVDSTAKVEEAIGKMSRLGVRRLGVTQRGKLVGLVTQRAMVAGTEGQQIVLPELTAVVIVCPYCDVTMNDKEELSKHIDGVHLGRGLLQGDKTKW